MKIIEIIRAATAYNHDKATRDALEALLSQHDNDLEDVNYEPSSETLELIEGVEDAMNEFDEDIATRRAELKEAVAEAREEEETEEGDSGNDEN